MTTTMKYTGLKKQGCVQVCGEDGTYNSNDLGRVYTVIHQQTRAQSQLHLVTNLSYLGDININVMNN